MSLQTVFAAVALTVTAVAAQAAPMQVVKLERVVVTGKATQVVQLPRVVVTGYAQREVAQLPRVVVTGYADAPYGLMAETTDGGGHFTEVVLRPRVTVAEPGMAQAAQQLHEEASEKCFIASSVNFPVRHEPTVTEA